MERIDTASWNVEVDKWLALQTARPTTINRYRQVLYKIERMDQLKSLDDLDLPRLVTVLVAEWQPSTRLLAATVLRQFWEHTGLPVPSPGWRRFRRSLANGIRKREPRIVPCDEFDDVAEATTPKLALFLRLLWETGLRLNEGLHLRLEDINRKSGVVQVRPHDGPLAWKPKSRAAQRFLPTTLAEKLHAAATSTYVFIEPGRLRYLAAYPKPMEKCSCALWPILRKLLKGAIRKAGTPGFRPHDLRHTRLTSWAIGPPEMNPKVLQYLAGHSHISTTWQIYTHLRPEIAIDQARRFLAQ